MQNFVSGFVLRRFCDLVADGVKTDQGFKAVHLNLVARDLKEFTGQDVTETQVYNHLCKWRARWVKICRLKDLSGAGWDENKFMITLSPDHYYAYTKHHPKDTQFLNQPLLNYIQMQTIFVSSVAIGRFNMGSNEPLGTQPQGDPIDLEIEVPSNATAHGAVGGRGTWAAGGAATWAAGAVGTSALGATSNYVAGVAAGGAAGIEAVAGKRKRSCHDEALMIKLVDTI
ncbi:hypothetical protein QOZ80_4AG0309310 [Eleusine coracana subsp. coracana]|nr:hypothetical protein QOZ80_4AG0309310 [Eleusine coracana subsp. coracana]